MGILAKLGIFILYLFYLTMSIFESMHLAAFCSCPSKKRLFCIKKAKKYKNASKY